jgi:hypothetical protein
MSHSERGSGMRVNGKVGEEYLTAKARRREGTKYEKIKIFYLFFCAP